MREFQLGMQVAGCSSLFDCDVSRRGEEGINHRGSGWFVPHAHCNTTNILSGFGLPYRTTQAASFAIPVVPLRCGRRWSICARECRATVIEVARSVRTCDTRVRAIMRMSVTYWASICKTTRPHSFMPGDARALDTDAVTTCTTPAKERESVTEETLQMAPASERGNWRVGE